jgi:hypothetical protein
MRDFRFDVPVSGTIIDGFVIKRTRFRTVWKLLIIPEGQTRAVDFYVTQHTLRRTGKVRQ